MPFGYEYNAQATVSAYKFAGYEHDAESGLENANLRQLSSQLARFTSPDPLSGSISDPQSLNRYAYARNNPLKFVDPSGAFSFLGLLQDIGGAISSGAGAAWGGISSFGGSVWGGISSFGGSVWGGVTDLFGPTPVSNFYDCQDCLITVDVNGNGNPPPPPPPPDVPLENDFLHNNPGCPTCGSTWGNYGQVADAGFWVEFTLASAAAAPLLPTAGEDLVLLDISPNVWQDPFLAPPGWSGEVGQEMPGYRGNENFFDERGEWHFHEPDAWHPDTHWDFKSWDNFNVPNTQQIPTTAFPPRL